MAEARSQTDRPPLLALFWRASLDQAAIMYETLHPSLHCKHHHLHHSYAGRLEIEYQTTKYM